MKNENLSQPLASMSTRYDVVVVGSGYGGSIAASRMARAGKSVCLLERGREIRPGKFPSKEAEAAKEVQIDSPKKHRGKDTNLYDFRLNEEISVFQGCGLGGTSLVNANVSLSPEDWVLDDPHWPTAIRESKSEFYEGRDRAIGVLQPAVYPEGTPGYPKLKKVEALRKSAQALGEEFRLTPINVRFEDGPNAVGVHQNKCNNCGDCVTGCNYKAKNTTLMNYLPDAVMHGAEIFVEVGVRYIERSGDEWLVYYEPYDPEQEKFGDELPFVRAAVVILGAGSLGSTEIMLRSKQRGLTMSDRVGKRFTGNGDALAFGYNNDIEINGVGLGHHPVGGRRAAPGPCIAGVIDVRKGEGEEGMVIEEGVAPGPISALLPAAMITLSKFFSKDTDRGVKDWFGEKWREIVSFFGGAYRGAIRNTQVYLVMTHDDGEGEMKLEDDRLRIHWPGVGKQQIFQKVKGKLEKSVKVTGGRFMRNPQWSKAFDFDLVTVHPLGGCAMADQAENGVVNHMGQVFSSDSGSEVYPGLVVCDGAIVPRPLGVNPLLTISALAERNCKLLAESFGWSIDYSSNEGKVLETNSVQTGIRFTEKMTGFIDKNVSEDFGTNCETGEQKNQSLHFVLTIESEDVASFLDDPELEAALSGTVTAPLLSESPLTVSNGSFNLFIDDPDQVNVLNMRYRMQLTARNGGQFYFEGFKVIRDDAGFDVVKDTTTLFVQIHEGASPEGPVLAKGVLRIKIGDFRRQMGTMEVTNAKSKSEELKWLARFGGVFSKNLFSVYGGIFEKANLFNPDAPLRQMRKLTAGDPTVFNFEAKDGLPLRLTRYQGGSKGPVMLVHGLGVSSKIFSIDTIDQNLVEALHAEGFDVWLIDYRMSVELASADEKFNGDEVAENDFQPAIDTIRAECRVSEIDVVAHCFGGTTISMALLNGLQGVRSLVISQVGPDVVAHRSNVLKSKLRLPKVLDILGVDDLTADTDSEESWIGKVYNTLLRLYPNDKEDRTTDPVSNRITFMYGQLYELDQLNPATFQALHEMFGVANINAFRHLSRMILDQKVVSFQGEDIYMAHMKARMAIPMTFIHGAENACYLPESTERTFNQLRKLNPATNYRRHVIPNYGHIDCIFGKRASFDVYPLIIQHLHEQQH